MTTANIDEIKARETKVIEVAMEVIDELLKLDGVAELSNEMKQLSLQKLPSS
jgi:hypothetical protein